MHMVKSCCCGCSLRTGTLILLWINLFPLILYFFTGLIAGVPQVAVLIAVLAIPYAGGIYGVVKLRWTVKENDFTSEINDFQFLNALKPKKRPSFLILYLAIQVLSLIIGIIAMIGFAIFGAFFFNELRSKSHSQIKDTGYQRQGGSGEEPNAAIIIGGVEVWLLILEAINYYFFVVVFSYYKKLKSEIVSDPSSMMLRA